MAAQLAGANITSNKYRVPCRPKAPIPGIYLTNFLLRVQFSSASAGSKHQYQHSGKIAEGSCVSKTASPLPFQAKRPLHGGAINHSEYLRALDG